ncbi:DNA glycosylase AlkZ-like family protein [Georgenia sp. Z1344]|uniref:DNA glycosylase AlkZ-like family protein n=1 Tax=Georgenia sp. Z1344 TaxID=3416706 RepID=UPI003CF7F66E
MTREIGLDVRQALAWRLDRHRLGTEGATDAVDVVRRVVALRGWPADRADLAVGVRLASPRPGMLRPALDDDELVLAYAFRGGAYVMDARAASVLLTVRRTTRVWESARYQRQAGFELDDWAPFRAAVRDLLGEGPASRDEIAVHLAGSPSLAHLVPAADGRGSDALYKPLHWWGDLSFGPTRDGRATFRLAPDSGDETGIGADSDAAIDAAGRAAVELYLAAYAPATEANLLYWLGEGLSAPRSRIRRWLDAAEVVPVTVHGVDSWVRPADLDEIRSARPSGVVRLLPAHDSWVLGPGTADERIVPTAHRAAVSRGADLVVRDGVVVGTWRLRGHEVSVEWFDDREAATAHEVGEELARVGRARGATLTLADD